MLDIKFVRENPELVKENIKKKFQDAKLPLVDEVLQLDAELRAAKSEAEALRASRNKLSKNIGALMAQGKKEEAEAVKRQVTENADRLKELEAQEAELSERLRKDMMTIPNIIDASVPHWQRRQRKRGGAALWRAGCAGFRGSVSHRYHGAL